MNFHDWLDIGVKNGWVSEPYCDTHDGGPFSEEEMSDFDEGIDSCRIAMRVWHV